MIKQLQELGCDVAQGFHWSQPVPAGEVQDVLDRVCVARSLEGARVPSDA
jgi:EAL domain-containing protein (putative c-di-GMP-specific phosphodiesterase class I)